jgi:hypothetical protein
MIPEDALLRAIDLQSKAPVGASRVVREKSLELC